MKLTAKQIQNAAPRDKAYKLWDGYHGLHLVVNPGGSKSFKVKYRFGGKAQEFTIGTTDTVSVAAARKAALEVKAKCQQGINPAAEKAQRRREQRIKADLGSKTIREVCRLWWDEHSKTLASGTQSRKHYVMEHYVLPEVGHLTFDELTPQALLPIITKIHSRSADTAVTASTVLRQSAQFAILRGWASSNPVMHLQGVLPQPKNSNFPSITDPARVGGLLRSLRALRDDNLVVGTALEVLARLASRPGEVRSMRFEQLDLSRAEWYTVQPKVNREVVVPLPRQVVDAIEPLADVFSNRGYVFPGRTGARPLSENTFNAALRRAGVAKDEHVAHGFRHTFSTLAHSAGRDHQIIESCLGHQVGSSVARTYNKASFLPQRRELLQWYSDYLDELRSGGA